MIFLAQTHWSRATVDGSFVLQKQIKTLKQTKIFMKQQPRSKALHITLWVLQTLLAAMFLMSGLMKVSQPIEKLSQSLAWTAQVSELLVRFIGVAEVLGALGLILPSLLRIKPRLTVTAALGLALVIVFAWAFHISSSENGAIGMNVVLLSIAAFIAW